MCAAKTETIVASATPLGKGGVAIVRISGPLVKEIALSVLNKLPSPRYAMFTPFFNETGEAIDEGIALFFPGPHSFTGEDVIEFHGHGGPCIVDSLIKRILKCGARLAKPGEFSERAFLNDKLDLAQSEAIADLIDATSEQAARSALRSLQGEFSKRIHVLVELVIRLRIYIEAAIDFVDEEIDFLGKEEVQQQFHVIINQLSQLESEATQGTLLREGITAVIAGEPNVGKSSLLNRLSEKEVAIVTHIPGTTRDVLKEYIHIDGMPMHVIDTAGIRESEDPVEQEGIRRARDEISRADIILFVTDASSNSDIQLKDVLTEIPARATVIHIKNKSDLCHPERSEGSPSVLRRNEQILRFAQDDNVALRMTDSILISAKTGMGIDLLKQKIKEVVGYQENSEGIFSARRRHLDALRRAHEFLEMAFKQLNEACASELIAEDLRQAQMALNEITGEFTSDDLLGRIFSSFCIGK